MGHANDIFGQLKQEAQSLTGKAAASLDEAIDKLYKGAEKRVAEMDEGELRAAVAARKEADAAAKRDAPLRAELEALRPKLSNDWIETKYQRELVPEIRRLQFELAKLERKAQSLVDERIAAQNRADELCIMLAEPRIQVAITTVSDLRGRAVQDNHVWISRTDEGRTVPDHVAVWVTGART